MAAAKGGSIQESAELVGLAELAQLGVELRRDDDSAREAVVDLKTSGA